MKDDNVKKEFSNFLVRLQDKELLELNNEMEVYPKVTALVMRQLTRQELRMRGLFEYVMSMKKEEI